VDQGGTDPPTFSLQMRHSTVELLARKFKKQKTGLKPVL